MISAIEFKCDECGTKTLTSADTIERATFGTVANYTNNVIEEGGES